jgi:hypothetical protein
VLHEERNLTLVFETIRRALNLRNMKITLDFDTEIDSMQVVVIALQADAVHGAIRDLVFQLNIWAQESPGDKQSKTCQQVLNWIMEEFPKRGLLFDPCREGKLQNRAGEFSWKRTDMSLHSIAGEIHSQAKNGVPGAL